MAGSRLNFPGVRDAPRDGVCREPDGRVVGCSGGGRPRLENVPRLVRGGLRRMSHVRVGASLLIALGLVGGVGAQAIGQDPSAGPGVLTYSSGDLTQAGTIMLRDIADPFTDFRADSPPGADQRYVLLTVRFQAKQAIRSAAVAHRAPGRRRLDLGTDIDQPPGGRTPTRPCRPGPWPRRPCVRRGRICRAQVATIDEILDSPTPPDDQDVLYRPTTGARLLPLLDQHPSVPPAMGTAVSDVSPDGRLAGTITVRGLTDPDGPPAAVPASVPASGNPSPVEGSAPAGQRYVLVDVVFEAAIDKPFEIGPQFIVLHDTDGNQYGHANVPLAGTPREEPLEHTLSPDDRVSGVVGFGDPRNRGDRLGDL